jgi:hypothetical protein
MFCSIQGVFDSVPIHQRRNKSGGSRFPVDTTECAAIPIVPMCRDLVFQGETPTAYSDSLLAAHPHEAVGRWIDS